MSLSPWGADGAPCPAKTLKHIFYLFWKDILDSIWCVIQSSIYLPVILSSHLKDSIIARSKWSKGKSSTLHQDDLRMYLEEYFIITTNHCWDLFMPCSVCHDHTPKSVGVLGHLCLRLCYKMLMWGPDTPLLLHRFQRPPLYLIQWLCCAPWSLAYTSGKPRLQTTWDIIESVPGPIDMLREKALHNWIVIEY